MKPKGNGRRRHRLVASFAIVQCACGVSYAGPTTAEAEAKLERHLDDARHGGGGSAGRAPRRL